MILIIMIIMSVVMTVLLILVLSMIMSEPVDRTGGGVRYGRDGDEGARQKHGASS